ncbi:MAG: hypothetical protein OXC05_12480 [Halieaceae bacterium]|nr:hypothetical protein [Halieaceae bacterium]
MAKGNFRAASATAIISLIFAVSGFSYNAWRLEQSEENNIVRNAAFQVLTELAEFEQVIYINRYDGNEMEGSPRLGWVKIGLVYDLSMLISQDVEQASAALKAEWTETWPKIRKESDAVAALLADVDVVRAAVKRRLLELQ